MPADDSRVSHANGHTKTTTTKVDDSAAVFGAEFRHQVSVDLHRPAACAVEFMLKFNSR
jgi:hypothetical protein